MPAENSRGKLIGFLSSTAKLYKESIYVYKPVQHVGSLARLNRKMKPLYESWRASAHLIRLRVWLPFISPIVHSSSRCCCHIWIPEFKDTPGWFWGYSGFLRLPLTNLCLHISPFSDKRGSDMQKLLFCMSHHWFYERARQGETGLTVKHHS